MCRGLHKLRKTVVRPRLSYGQTFFEEVTWHCSNDFLLIDYIGMINIYLFWLIIIVSFNIITIVNIWWIAMFGFHPTKIWGMVLGTEIWGMVLGTESTLPWPVPPQLDIWLIWERLWRRVKFFSKWAHIYNMLGEKIF